MLRLFPRVSRVAAIAVAALFLVACSDAGTSPQATDGRAQTPSTLAPTSAGSPDAAGRATSSVECETSGEVRDVAVVEAIHTLLYLPMYVADQAGIFERNGINLNLTSSGAGPAALASVLAGEAQFSVHGPEHVAFANAQGGDAVLVSAMANSVPVWLLAREELSIPEDLPGLTVNVGQQGTTPYVVFTRYLADNDIPVESLNINEVQQGTEIGPVLAGQSDVAVTLQPAVESGINQGLQIVHDFTEEDPQFVFSGVATSRTILESDPEMVSCFVASIDEALAFMREDPERTKEIAAAEFPELEEDVVSAGVDRMTESNVYPQSALITEEALAASMDLQVYMGNLETAPAYDELVAEEFTP